MPFPPQTTYSTSEELQEVERCEVREKMHFSDYYLKLLAPKILDFLHYVLVFFVIMNLYAT
jgi:hypothetical protein